MSIRKWVRLIEWCVFCVVLILPKPEAADAAGTDRFVMPGGSTTSSCVQSDPCDLPTAMGIVAGNDSLYFAAGTYTGTGTDPVLAIDQNNKLFGGWDGSMTFPPVVDPNTYISILDGEDIRQVVAITSDSYAILEGFTITRGQAVDGAGIFISGSSPSIQYNIITDNHTIDGGTGWDDGRGGGIFIEGTSVPSILNNNINNNSSGYGGGYYHHGGSAPIVQSNVFLNNDASERGGAMIIEDSTDIIVSNTFKENSAYSDGGAILIWHADPLISANLFENNTASNGTALSLGNNARPEIDNNIMFNHDAATVLINYSTPQFINNTLVRTSPVTVQKGIMLISSETCEEPFCAGGSYRNNIITGFATGFHAGTLGLVEFSMDYNAYYANIEDSYIYSPGFDAGSHNVFGNPQFVNSAVGNFHLWSSSPCIDSGDPAGVPPAPGSDYDGTSRPQGLAVDIGAFELSEINIYLPLMMK